MFRVGVTRDFLKPDGSNGFGDIGLDGLAAAGLAWDWLPPAGPALAADLVAGYDGLLVLGPRVTADTVSGGRLKVVARFGVGYDNVDVPALTAAGVLLTITPEGVRRPVAVAALTLVLALSHKLLVKDRLTRAGRWADKLDHNGQGLTGRTLGIVGFGNIGRELARIARPLDLTVLAADPLADPANTAAQGVSLRSLDDLLAESDYVVVCCVLTPDTRHLINAARLARMKPTGYLVNVARGPIVDQAALTRALQERRIAGAGLDVFDPEPVAPDDPLLGLENVILSPHALCWTDECFGLNGRSAVAALVDVANGRVPPHVVNREALGHPNLRHLKAAS